MTQSMYLRTEELPLESLTPFPGNAKRGAVDRIRESLKEHGQYRALVVRHTPDGAFVVLAGNHTLLALKAEGVPQARCELIACDDSTARKINLIDNRAADLGTWDEDALAELLAALDGDLTGTGWDPDDIEDPLGSIAGSDGGIELGSPMDDIEDSPPVPEITGPPVTRPGDVWELGPHKIMCGDCRNGDDVSALLAGAVINLAFTSPPYAKQRDYDEASGFKSVPPDEYVDWFAPVAANVAEHLAADGSWFVNIKATPGDGSDWLDTPLYAFDLVTSHVRKWGWHFATEFCWERNGVPKNVTRRFKNQFEPVYQFARSDWKMRPDAVRHASNDVPVPGGPGTGDSNWKNAQGGDTNAGSISFGGSRHRDRMSDHQGESGGSLLDGNQRGASPGLAYPGNRLPTFSGSHTATGHTAAFPVGLPQWFIRAYTDPGDVVYDPFMGSGSTLLAADREGRTGYGMEISPKYCDVICWRYQQVTGVAPVRNGEPHDFSDGS